MLRIYFLQHWFNLSDPSTEEALNERECNNLDGISVKDGQTGWILGGAHGKNCALAYGGTMPNPDPINQQLIQIVTTAQPVTIPDVIQVTQSIDALLWSCRTAMG
jgi:hypothetical protein